MKAQVQVYAHLELVQRGPQATIWMNRPAVFNAFDEALIDELHRAVQQLEADPTVRVIVLAGRGPHFSAGADLNWMRRAAAADAATNQADALRFARMLRALATCRKPTVARVQGAALGGGTGLAAACDIAVASADAVFATSEVRFGIIPAVISPYVLRAIGPRQAMRYFQTAERIRAPRALAIGLVHEVCEVEALDETVQRGVDALLEGGPQAQFAAKQLIEAVLNHPLDDALLELTAQRIARQRVTDEGRDGIAAFLDKRAPAWKNAL